MPDCHRPKRAGLVVLWVLCFLICTGLGYPTLRRYDPRDPRTNFDGTTALYHWQVTGDAHEGDFGPSLLHFRYRLLVPSVARVFYLLGKSRVGSWDPGYFGFLVANSIFCSSTASLLFLVATDVYGDRARAFVASLLYLISFAVPNFLLAGLVDSGEAFSLMALVWLLWRRRWWGLPLIGIVGALAKETFLPFSVALAGGWLVVYWRENQGVSLRKELGWVVLLAMAAVATLTVVFSAANGRLVFPWQLALSGTTANVGLWQRAVRLALDVTLIYVFGWLGVFGLFGFRGLPRCPRPWMVGALLSATTAVALGIVNGEPGLARSLFNILGPLLSLGSAAII